MRARCAVLVVDDDAPIRTSVAEVLEDEGYCVRQAGNGAEALAQLRAHRDAPGLILLDLRMPFMDGSDFRLQQLQDPELASIPVVLLSADTDVVAKAAALKANEILRKPFGLEELLEVAAKYCGGWPDAPQ